MVAVPPLPRSSQPRPAVVGDARPRQGARVGHAMLDGAVQSMGAAALAERRFYSLYAWCLNPILSVPDLLDRLGEELGRMELWDVPWQREESMINAYLLACAVACSIDDAQARAPRTLSAVSARFPAWRNTVSGVGRLLHEPERLTRLGSQTFLGWRRAWDRSVDRLCDLLVDDAARVGTALTEVRADFEPLLSAPLPGSLLREKMRLPEAYRCQDLTHHDVIALGRRVAGTFGEPPSRTMVMGVRTAGSYIAPLIRATLSAAGWAGVSWMTVRPKLSASRSEARELRHLATDGARVIVVDDYQNTGGTMQLVLDLLTHHAVPRERVTVAVPRHPARLGWTLPPEAAGARLVTLEPDELYKIRLLEPAAMEALFQEYAPGEGLRVEESARERSINEHLRERIADGFQVRVKRVFELRSGVTGEGGESQRIFVKSVGWGWLGYHAYFMGARLAGAVPRLIGLRNGLLLTEWLDDGRPCAAEDVPDHVVDAIAHYTARRVEQLPLPKDPTFDTPEYRWTGWSELVSILRGVYGSYVGPLKTSALRRELRRFVSPMPTALDGRMRPEDWIETPAGVWKSDFEQHSFGGAELDVVDPAFDLAGAMCEFSLSEPDAQRLVEMYARESGDRAVTGRLLLHEILYGVVTMRRALSNALAESRADRLEEWNRRRLMARRFLVSRMNRWNGGLLGLAQPSWSKQLLFLELDGVFDSDALGFPHTTPSGLAALRVLRDHDVSIVLNTSRSVLDVRDYCRAYGLAGGLGEFGSVFVDAVAGRDLALIDAEGGAELARCREAIRAHTDVCCDPSYRHSIRAYRYRDGKTVGLASSEVTEILAEARSEHLVPILRSDDTLIVQEGRSKDTGIGAVRRYLGCLDEPAAAIGTSDDDVAALSAVERGYAPANCAPSVRKLARRGRCRVMRERFQRGLLEAARDLVGDKRGSAAPSAVIGHGPRAEAGELMGRLLETAELSAARHWLGALKVGSL